ncbi:MAG: autotransporter-associated beta strand repeat-containing protein [Kiritimatiellae bacterium]|jgi:autotransporter-associated beta strand protein|nr:autotransporter-associated beta strand repeat-containing protein [Kiritimatiellia bacterium]
MNPTQKTVLLTFASALLLIPSTLFSADGSWSTDADGNWNSAFASGSGNTATFANDITGDRTISLIEPITIGNVVFGDANTATAGGWTLNNNSNAINILTLEGGTPSITVNALGSGKNAVISAEIAGTSGFNKEGSGRLVLSGANSVSGAINLNEGRIIATNSSALGSGVLTMTSGTNLYVQGGVNISNELNIIGTGSGGSSAIYTAANANTLSGDVNLLGDARISGANVGGGNQLTLSGTVDLGTYILQTNSFGTAGQIFITGDITGSGRLQVSGGNLTVTKANTGFTGDTRLSGGGSTLFVGNDQALGIGGTLEFLLSTDNQLTFRSTDSTARTIANALAFTGGNSNSRYVFGGGGNLLFTGDATLANLRGFRIQNSVTEFSGDISGNGGIRKESNSGTLVLSGTNSYTGETIVNISTLLLNGTHTGGNTYTVNNSGILGGTGSTTSDITVNAGGTLSPGASIESLGTGGITFDGGAFLYEINTDLGTADLLYASDATTALTLGNTPILSLTDLGSNQALAVGTKFTLMSYNAGWNNGVFDGYEDGSIFTALGNDWQINYADTEEGSNFTSDATGFGDSFVTLTVIPEPGTLALVGISLMVLAVFGKRDRR